MELRGTLTLPGGLRVFVKESRARDPKKRDVQRRRLALERLCLEALSELAVTRLVKLPAAQIKRLLDASPADVLLQEQVRGGEIDKIGLSETELFGAWLFVVEQLTAMRRHDILYSDLKCGNVLATRRPLSVTIVDFGYGLAVEPSGVYRASAFGMTMSCQAPEQSSSARVTEQALVFQLGLLLPHIWFHASNTTLNDPRKGLPRLRRELRRHKAEDYWGLLSSCLAADPRKRPADYEAVLVRVQALTKAGSAPEAVKVWRKLRAPYAAYLARGGM